MGNVCWGVRPSILEQASLAKGEKKKNRRDVTPPPPSSRNSNPPPKAEPAPRKTTPPQPPKPAQIPAQAPASDHSRPLQSFEPAQSPVQPQPHVPQSNVQPESHVPPLNVPPQSNIPPQSHVPPQTHVPDQSHDPHQAQVIQAPFAPQVQWVAPTIPSPREEFADNDEESIEELARLQLKVDQLGELYHAAENQHGYVEKDHLRMVLRKMQIMDKDVHEFLWKRYDTDYNGLLDFEEFCEMMLDVMAIKKSFESADRDQDRSIDTDEILSVVDSLGITLSSDTILSLMELFDKDHSGGVEFNEYLPLSIYLNELVYQFKKFKTRKPEDIQASSKWLHPLLGSIQDEESSVAKELSDLLTGEGEPTADQFVRIIVTAAKHNEAQNFKQNVKVPQITKKRRPKNPTRGIKPRQLAKLESGEIQLQHDHDKHEGDFCDPDFVPSRDILPSRAKDTIVWKRPKEIHEKAALIVDGVDEGDVIQGALGDCWFLGALAVVAAITTNFVHRMFVRQRPEIGYYCCRFFKDGKWVEVEVDDRLPCYPSGQLYCASCKDHSEFWVPIAEKAYAKLHGSYTALEGGSISDALKDLTGGGIEILRWKEEEKDAMWDKIRSYAKKHYLMGCSIDSAAAAETQLDCGLLVNHAYSIIKCKEVDGIRFVRIRNPWGEGEWKGAWSDDSDLWTEEWKRKKFVIKYTFTDDGSFFMRFEDYIQYFNRIYVLRCVTESSTESWEMHSFTGEWKDTTASGCKNNPRWLNNPQYAIQTKEANTKIFINLSQPCLRYKEKKNLETIRSESKKDYESIGLYVLKTSDPTYKKTVYNDKDKVGSTSFTDVRDLSFEFECDTPGTYVILPCTYDANKEAKYNLTLYANKPVVVARELREKTSKSLAGEWKGITAGGCMNNRETCMNNPQYLLRCSDHGPVDILLAQDHSKALEPIGIYIFAAHDEARLETLVKPLIKPHAIVDDALVSETLTVDEGESYIIMPTTFDDKIERSFTLTVVSESIQVFRLL